MPATATESPYGGLVRNPAATKRLYDYYLATMQPCYYIGMLLCHYTTMPIFPYATAHKLLSEYFVTRRERRWPWPSSPPTSRQTNTTRPRYIGAVRAARVNSLPSPTPCLSLCAQVAVAIVAADAENGKFPIKDKDTGMARAFEFLRSKARSLQKLTIALS